MKKFLMQNSKKHAAPAGQVHRDAFYENSTRTRMSFELATKYMGAASANIAASGSSVSKGETLIDTGCSLDMMGTDLIIMRHPMSGAPHLLAQHVKSGVINAGDGMNEHPTQGLLDMFTMREKLGTAGRPEGRHRRRHRPQPRGPQQHVGLGYDGQRGRAGGAGDAAARGHGQDGRAGDDRRRCGRPSRRRCRDGAAHTDWSGSRPGSSPACGNTAGTGLDEPRDRRWPSPARW